jgi:sporulation protein YlmC with PRC-barrel domain
MKIKQMFAGVLASSLTIGLLPQAVLAKDNSSSSSSGSKGTSEVLMSKIIGTDLKTAKGEDLGEVKDLVIDPTSGRIRFAIVGLQTSSGAEALAPIPWKAVNLQAEKQYVATIDKSKLYSGPHMSQQEWDKLMQPDYVVEVYRFYGFEPPSAEGSAESPGGSSGGSQQNHQSGQQ